MRNLIIGGTGFLGKAVADLFAQYHHEVRIYSPSAGVGTEANASGVSGSIEDFAALEPHLDWADTIFHFAATSSPHQKTIDIKETVDRHLLPLIDILKFVSGTQKKLVYCSSGGAVYGTSHGPIHEDSPLAPVSTYGLIKKTMEGFIQFYHQNYGLDALVLRPSNVYGPKTSGIGKQGVISTLIANALENKPTRVWVPGETKKDYIFISDFAFAVFELVAQNASGVYNVGSGVSTTLIEIIEGIQRAMGKPVQVEWETGTPDVEFVLNVAKLNTLTNWKPLVSLQQGIQITVDTMTKTGI